VCTLLKHLTYYKRVENIRKLKSQTIVFFKENEESLAKEVKTSQLCRHSFTHPKGAQIQTNPNKNQKPIKKMKTAKNRIFDTHLLIPTNRLILK
jgi:hypothetical protein